MLVRRLVDRVRRACGLRVFDSRRKDWIITRRRGGIRMRYCIICASKIGKMLLVKGSTISIK